MNTDMKPIVFTQYMRPDGHKEYVSHYTSDEDVYKKAQEIINEGFTFEIEVLRTGQISMTITDHEQEIDVAIRVCNNGPEVITNVNSLIRDFDINQALAQRDDNKLMDEFEEGEDDEPAF